MTARRDVIAAARLIAAVGADDEAAWSAVINEARTQGWLTELCLATAARAAAVADGFLDADARRELDLGVLMLMDAPDE